ncbi:hypothetical protein ACFRDV_32560 [Streptomyces fagopyri]
MSTWSGQPCATGPFASSCWAAALVSQLPRSALLAVVEEPLQGVD